MSDVRPILVIDDDQKLCGLIRDYLEPLGYDVTRLASCWPACGP
jgi:DNA-binding response OmpR family regulator